MNRKRQTLKTHPEDIGRQVFCTHAVSLVGDVCFYGNFKNPVPTLQVKNADHILFFWHINITEGHLGLLRLE